jgi:hypothetical protein
MPRHTHFDVALVLLCSLAATQRASGQVTQFPFVENFDTTVVNALPAGWSASGNRVPPSNDFTVAASLPRSSPNALLSTNATIAQWVATPLLDFGARLPDSILLYTRRSSTHTARVVVEASLDSGLTYPLLLGDSLVFTSADVYVRASRKIPDTLRTSPRSRIRWRVVPITSGPTATFRIDDVTITALSPFDLSLVALRFNPPRPIEGDSVTAIATVRNVGLAPADSFSVEFYADANRDSIPQPSEFLTRVHHLFPLAVSDSVDVTAALGQFGITDIPIIGKVVYTPDLSLANNQRIVALIVGYPPGSVVVNEIMYAPASPEPEWVELFNRRTDSVAIRGWLVSDANTTTKRLITQADLRIAPQSYVILTRDSGGVLEVHPNIPVRVINVSGFPTLNNTGDAVVIYDQRVLTMDSLTYAPGWGGNTGGRSLERMDPFGPSTAQSNWGSSRHASGSTPGIRNSLTRKDRDLLADTLWVSPLLPVVRDSLTVQAKVRNIGTQPAGPFSVLLYEDANGDSIAQPTELIATLQYGTLLPSLDSTAFSVRRYAGRQGVTVFIARVVYSPDEDSTNNTKLGGTTVGFPPGSVRLNEIMYAPAGEPEWIEVQNVIEDTVNIARWSLSNRFSTTKYTLGQESLVLAPDGRAVLTKDTVYLLQKHGVIPASLAQVSTLPTALFNNSGDAVVLFDRRNALMDSVFYSSSWGGTNGRSLERVSLLGQPQDSANWRGSTAPIGSTPGRKNSVTRKDHDLALSGIVFTPQVPVIRDSVEVTSKVLNKGLHPAAPFTVRQYHDRNRDSVAQQNELIASFDVTVPLLPDDSSSYSVRVYLDTAGEHRFISMVSYAGDEDTTDNRKVAGIQVGYPPGAVRVNEVMYAPQGGMPEWVELVNVSADTVDLRNWKLANRLPSRYTITSGAVRLPPDTFVVVTKDSALLRSAYAIHPARVIQAPSLPTFLWNNSGDAVVLVDDRNSVSDSVFYLPSWGGTGGKSLERIDLFSPSQDSLNWVSSLDSGGATPARPNAARMLDDDLAITDAFAADVRPDEPATIVLTVRNVGRNPSSPFILRLYDDRNADSTASADELFDEATFTQLIPSRTSVGIERGWISPPGGVRNLIATLAYTPDQRLANNTRIFRFKVGFAPLSMVINEIMYAPLSGEAEYVELVNVSEQSVNLMSWTMSDRPGTSGTRNVFSLSSKPLVVPSNGLFVIASDSSIHRRFPHLQSTPAVTILRQSSLSLNNDGDDIVLKDPLGEIIDSVAYLPSWHNPGVSDKTGRSLEKINPALGSNDDRNWSTCALPVGGTPGRQNSIYARSLPVRSKLSVTPNPFSPDADGRDDFTIIHYEIPLAVSTISVKIFDMKGRLVKRLANNEPAGSQGNIVWDGRDEEQQVCRIGIYIILFEASDPVGGIIESAKATVVLAKKL